jgi:broad specificity phosphatase PhoE
VEKSDFQILEDEKSLERRIRKFMKTLEGKDGTILLVTHMGVINKIILGHKRFQAINKSLPTTMNIAEEVVQRDLKIRKQ